MAAATRSRKAAASSGDQAGSIDAPYLAAHYAVPESTITSLLDEPTVELVKSLLESISEKAKEHDQLQSEKLRVDVQLENAVRSGESKARVLKSNVDKGLAEISTLRASLQEQGNSTSFSFSHLNLI